MRLRISLVIVATILGAVLCGQVQAKAMPGDIFIQLQIDYEADSEDPERRIPQLALLPEYKTATPRTTSAILTNVCSSLSHIIQVGIYSPIARAPPK